MYSTTVLFVAFLNRRSKLLLPIATCSANWSRKFFLIIHFNKILRLNNLLIAVISLPLNIMNFDWLSRSISIAKIWKQESRFRGWYIFQRGTATGSNTNSRHHSSKFCFHRNNTPVHQLHIRETFPWNHSLEEPVCGTFFPLNNPVDAIRKAPTHKEAISAPFLCCCRIHGINSRFSSTAFFKSPLSEGIKIRSDFSLHAIKDPDGR